MLLIFLALLVWGGSLVWELCRIGTDALGIVPGEENTDSVSGESGDGEKEGDGESDRKNEGKEAEDEAAGSLEQAKEIAAACRDIYSSAAEAQTLGQPDTVRQLVNRLGEYGYAAVDSENQINMANADQVTSFCRSVEEESAADLTLTVVAYDGSFTLYALETEEGQVTVEESTYRPFIHEEGGQEPEQVRSSTYTADFWQYTEEGYLMFTGSWFSDEYYLYALSEVPEYAAIRVQPLDEACREYNRKYLLPVGYGKNNLFLADWTEDAFGELDFYDLFDAFYTLVWQQEVPYEADDNYGVGAVYHIPARIFEQTVMAHVDVGRNELRQRTVWLRGENAYEYKPRGFYESEYPQIPYPEVVAYRENGDGTVTLTVNAVYPQESSSRLFTHEVVVRKEAEGGFSYVSNRITYWQENYEAWWHSDRLSAEEWEEIYGGE